ncbi:ExeA family protein [Thermodesulfobacteriota bacterium]
MDYFSILNLNKEPFSNSPDPDYFFQSVQHLGCLQKLELSIRLKRGLNVVVGDVGTGKTTLCRQLIRNFANDKNSETHLILDPYFSTPMEFLVTVAGLFEDQKSFEEMNDWQIKEAIKQYIFKKGVDENKTIVLIIDEGQKIPEFCLEILREFLNFETNEFKLLQIVIFAQKEIEEFLDKHANVADRINLYHLLGPLNFKDTRQMIRFRINQSSSISKRRSIFSFPALWAIYRETKGYPRKIVNLCHQIMLAMIIQNKTRAGWSLVRSCAKRATVEPAVKWRRVVVTFLVVAATVSLTIALAPDSLRSVIKWDSKTVQTQDAPVASVKIEPNEIQTGESGRKENPVETEPVRNPETNSGTGNETKTPKENVQVENQQQASLTLPDVRSGETEKSLSKPVISGDELEMPVVLGEVALQHNETLWRLIEKVRGVCSPQDIRSVKKANSFIRNPNFIKAGRPISIPAVPVTVKSSTSDVWWVKIGEKDRLDEAIDILRGYPEDAPPLRLIPYWNRKDLKFAILLRDHFPNESEADRQLQLVPSGFVANATLMSTWPEDLVFFADPYVRPRM